MLLVAFSLIFLLALSNFRQQRAGITSLTFVDVYQRSMLRFRFKKNGGQFRISPKKYPFQIKDKFIFFEPKKHRNRRLILQVRSNQEKREAS